MFTPPFSTSLSLPLSLSLSPAAGHLGFFRESYLPTRRGFDYQTGLWNAKGDHFEHTIGGGYDWHINDELVGPEGYVGNYSGDLVRDQAVAFIQNASKGAKPFFAYVAFQEVHSPFQVDKKYSDMYPHLPAGSERQILAGMITHTDEMIGDIVSALTTTGLLDNTIIVFSADKCVHARERERERERE